MAYEVSGFNRFAVALLEAAHRALKRATDGLTDEQLYFQPTPDTNSIAWLAWHLSRWKDRYGAMVSGNPQVWVGEGWADQFGIDAHRTGLGDSAEQVASFRVDPALLFGYVDAAHRATVERVAQMTPAQLELPFHYMPTGDPRPAWQAFIATAMDFTQHTGQIAYLRGLIRDIVVGAGLKPAPTKPD